MLLLIFLGLGFAVGFGVGLQFRRGHAWVFLVGLLAGVVYLVWGLRVGDEGPGEFIPALHVISSALVIAGWGIGIATAVLLGRRA